MNHKLGLKFTNQRLDGWEAWIGSDDEYWVRLDFLLEYYISKTVDLSKIIKGKSHDKDLMKKYGDDMFRKFMSYTSNGQTFNYKNYNDFLSIENPSIQKALAMLNN